MVRRRLILALAAAAAAACEPQADMAESPAPPDSGAIHEAMTDRAARTALLDSMPGGEMAVGDSAAESDLMREKMP